jgi:hypothetical protein
MDVFTAAVQRNLSYLVIGGTIILIFLSGIQWGGAPIFVVQESMANRLFDAAFLVVLLFWFQRQRPETTKTEIITDPKGDDV